PKGADGPGNVSTSPTTSPPLPVPMKVLTSAAGSGFGWCCWFCADAGNASETARAVPSRSAPALRVDNVVIMVDNLRRTSTTRREGEDIGGSSEEPRVRCPNERRCRCSDELGELPCARRGRCDRRGWRRPAPPPPRASSGRGRRCDVVQL